VESLIFNIVLLPQIAQNQIDVINSVNYMIKHMNLAYLI